MSPTQITVQLLFERPLEISQGNRPDLVHINMLRSVLMVERGKPVWELTNTELDYKLLSAVLPKQTPTVESHDNLVAFSKKLNDAAAIFFYMPLGMHLCGLGSMDMAWVIFRQM